MQLTIEGGEGASLVPSGNLLGDFESPNRLLELASLLGGNRRRGKRKMPIRLIRGRFCEGSIGKVDGFWQFASLNQPQNMEFSKISKGKE